MKDIFRDVVEQYFEVPNPKDSEIDAMVSLFVPLSKPKGTILFHEGDQHSYCYLLLKGAARGYFLKNGLEVNTWFAFDEDLLGNMRSYFGEPADETIELLEDSELFSIDIRGFKPLLETNFLANVLTRKILEENTIYMESRIQDLLHKTAQEKYEALLRKEPEVFNRVSLTHIASYLGMSRENLSRIRAKRK